MIQSIKAQTYKNWEAIIIDDGSTDNTGKICDEFIDDQIKVFHCENKGQIEARINGIFKASGDYTLVVDSDDRLHVDCLESINQVLDKHQYDCVSFPYRLYDEKMNYVDETIPPSKIGELSQREFLHWIIDTLNHPLYNKVVRTERIRAGANEAIRDKVSINGDYALVVPIASNTEDIFYLDKALYDYRVFDKSISHKRSYKQVIDTDIVSNSVSEILKSHGLLDEEFERLIFVKYLKMLEWLLCEISHNRFLLSDELRVLRGSAYYQSSVKYETRRNFSRNELLILRSIRKSGKTSLFKMNMYLKMTNLISDIKHLLAD